MMPRFSGLFPVTRWTHQASCSSQTCLQRTMTRIKLAGPPVAAICVIILMLSGCSGSPSKPQIEAAFAQLVAQDASGTEIDTSQFSVENARCTKVGNGIFECEVLVTAPANQILLGSSVGFSSAQGRTLQGRIRMTKLGGEWRAEHIQ